MNLSEHFIRRPVMTVLLNLAFLAAGILGYRSIPVSALPSYDTPVINVSASLPGASPETMASSVALPLEQQFQQIPGLVQMSSTSTSGTTSLTLEFAEGKSMDGAALDVQAALLRAQRTLPDDMTRPPSYRKVNPADAPVLIAAITSDSMALTEMQDYAEHLIVPTLSMIDGVAQVNVYGSKRFAVRVEVHPAALAARNLSLDDVSKALAAANANTPLGSLDGNRQTLTIVNNQQLARAADFADLIIASRNGATVRLRDVAEVKDSIENTRSFGNFEGKPSIVLAIQRQPDANTVRVVDGVRQALDNMRAQLPAAMDVTPFIDRSLSVREALHDVSLTLLGTIALVILVIF
ncbi:MAG: efflux RND transporter permease subunit, partial [Hydrogenophaga sp.]|nr:efflux RND transporter permease subunit [Hydrogenophaga sp.]